jgi:fumarate reductase flavoprotein subunit
LLNAGLALTEEKKPFTADRHKSRAVECKGCHGVEKPDTTATSQSCLACHQSLEAVAEKTGNRQPNPHKNHLTESSDIECTQCHASHKEDALVCHQCHTGLEFVKQETESGSPQPKA